MAMRSVQWLSLVVLCCLALVQPPATAAEPYGQDPAGALILYDSSSPYGWLGELHALQIANLLGHFPVESTIEPVESYLAGEVEDHAVTFYIGDVYDNPLPGAFLSDVMTTERTICWFKYNLWQIAWDEDYYWDPDFTFRYGFQFVGMDPFGFPEILYKGESLVKDLSDPDLGTTEILNADQAEVRAVAYRPDTDAAPEASYPYVVHAANLWYFADTPLTYVSEEDRYLVFCDLLHDIVGIDHAPSRRGLIRIEDVDPTCDPADLKRVADYLHSQDVPFQVAVIPVFADPLGVESGGEPTEIRLSESPEVVSALEYMVARGGQIILHGYTHQYDATPNPYNGLTGDDCEFFRASWNEEEGHTELLGPVDEDSVAWVNDRIDQGLSELSACGLSPVAWETPHYLASALDSAEFARRFDLTSGRILYFSSSTPYFAGQFYPYLIESDVYGQRISPENLGNVEPEPFYDYPARLPADIVRAAEINLVVRDAWASAYFHPYLHLRYLKQVVQGVKQLGYTYAAIPPLSADAGPDKSIVVGASITLEGSASDGTPPYAYSWSPTTGLDHPTEAQPTASPASTTTYTLTVTDDRGQTAGDLVTVTVVPAVVADAGPDKSIAAEGSTTLEGSASGGIPPYSYSWSPTSGLDDANIAQPTASPMTTTTYTLTVTDDLGQTDTDSVTVTVAAAVAADAGPDKAIASGGSALLQGSASGGVPPYSYSWSPTTGLNDPNIAQPTATPATTTTYTLTVTDDLSQADTDSVTVTVAAAVAADAGPDKTIASSGSAALDGSASGGVSPYSYSWTPTSGLDDPNIAQPTASPTTTTIYTLTVTDDLGQTDTDTVTVTVAAAVAADAGPDKTIASGGSATLQGSASGGVSPYSYSWTPTSGLDDPNIAQPVASPTGTTTYTLTVTDDLGQTDTDAVMVIVAPPVVAEAGADKSIPAGGSSVLQGMASSGLPPYSYSWSPTTGLDDPTKAQPTASPSSTTIYTLTVADDLGQTDTDAVMVTVVPPVVAEAGPSKTIAAGGQTTLQGSVSGGLPPYTYSWSPTTGLDDPNIAEPTAAPASMMTYTLTVTDDLGQTDTDTVTVTVASGVVADAGSDTTIASGGSTTLQGAGSGGLPPYTYAWSPSTGLSSPSIAQPAASPTSTITYTLTVSDDLGQTDTDTVTVTVLPPVFAQAGSDKTVTPGDSTTLEGSASGGVPPYSYAWSPTAGLSDASAPQPVASPTSTTTYTLTVTDDYGQTDTDTVTVTVAAAVAAEAGPDTTIASGGSTILQGSASGGVSPYSYSWSPTAGLSDASAPQPVASPTSTTTYTLTVTDDYGQTDTDTVTVTMATVVVAEAGPDKTIASGGSALLQGSASGGVSPYSYSWTPTTGLDDPAEAQPTATPATTTTYTLTVTDDLGQTDSDTVTVTVAAAVTADAGPDKTIASGGSAALQGSASGGVPPYSYSWSPTSGLNDPNIAQPTASPASTTTYTLTVTDDLGQTDTDSVTVSMLSEVFSDVPEDHWASAEIAACVNAGIVSGYDDGQYHGDWSVDRAQMGVYIARAEGWVRIGDDMTTAPELFPDVPRGYWAGTAIQACVDHKVSAGYAYPDPDNPGATIYLYAPTSIVTRDQMAVYVARSMADPIGEDGLADYVPTNPRNFPDVPNTGYGENGTELFWAYKHVEYCVEHGVVQGYEYPDPDTPGETFYLYQPLWPVTRDQMAVYIARAFELPT